MSGFMALAYFGSFRAYFGTQLKTDRFGLWFIMQIVTLVRMLAGDRGK